jgi:predicted alpha/beta-hydrolase family hydrolase
MVEWSNLLGTIGTVVTLDYPYRIEGRNRPDPLPTLIEAHRVALQRARENHSGPVVLIGKSMGGRVGCHVALQEKVAAVVCLGYPLCGAGDRAKLRDKVLLELRTPILFVQGTRDSLCPLELLEAVRAKMQADHELHVVEGGDHSLIVAKRQLKETGETQSAVNARARDRIATFVRARIDAC